MEIELRCPACRARQKLSDGNPASVYCRRCDADLSLMVGVTAKVKRLRARLASADSATLSVLQLEQVRNELKLWDPAGRVE